MITTDGKLHIKRYLAGWTPTIAQSIAFGIGGSAEAVGDTRLGFEAARSEVVLTSYDFVNDRLIYKAVVPNDFAGTIYEIGLFSTSANDVAGEFGSRLISTFDSDSETWLVVGTDAPGTYVTANSRIATDSLRSTTPLSTNDGVLLRELSLDLSGYSGADKFQFAYNVTGANTNNIQIRFYTDATNYFQFALGVQTAGYKIVEVDKSTATSSGTPSWDNISEIRAYNFANAGGTSTVDYDGIRIEDTDTINPEYVMVARELLTTPVTKEAGKILEVEFSLKVTL